MSVYIMADNGNGIFSPGPAWQNVSIVGLSLLVGFLLVLFLIHIIGGSESFSAFGVPIYYPYGGSSGTEGQALLSQGPYP